MVRNACMTWLQQYRKDRMTVPLSEDHLAVVREGRDTDGGAIEQSNRAAVERAVAGLPVEFREVIVLRELQGLSYAELGRVIGVPIGTIMSRLSRARQRLAANLGRGAREAS